MALLILMLSSFYGAGAFVFAADGAGAGIFENGAEAAKFRSKIKRDIFYTDADAERIKSIIALQQSEKPPEPKLQPVAVQTGPAPGVPQPPQPPAQPLMQTGPSAMSQNADTAQVEFRVEGIIKIGNRGCAIINSSVWGGESKIMFVGKAEMGYILKKLDTEGETVEIKTPTGSVIKRGLEKPKK